MERSTAHLIIFFFFQFLQITYNDMSITLEMFQNENTTVSMKR